MGMEGDAIDRRGKLAFSSVFFSGLRFTIPGTVNTTKPLRGVNTDTDMEPIFFFTRYLDSSWGRTGMMYSGIRCKQNS